MPEPIDFDPMVELRKYFIDDGPAREARQSQLLDLILRQVWNARGAADIATLDRDDLTDAIRKLDR